MAGKHLREGQRREAVRMDARDTSPNHLPTLVSPRTLARLTTLPEYRAIRAREHARLDAIAREERLARELAALGINA